MPTAKNNTSKPGPNSANTVGRTFAVRGFMLDISRGKVPTRRELARLVDLLARLRYNHFQLYVEHTYAFAGHEKVWRRASPLKAADIQWLQARCARKGLELSANFNSFGHFERWLKHPEYQHLAECPDGFEHPIKGKMPHGTTLQPNTASLKFLDKLWAEYLPLFKSKRFNLGGDEPWELGLGWSKPLVKKFGKHRVYLDFLKKLYKQAKKHGKEMLFWGDILLESPKLVKEVPADATALLWGYEANHPFAEQCAKLAAAKRKFWICPGTSAWNTFTGRTDNMRANIESAVKNGLAYGAEGLLLTSWGDGGNHQPWPVMYAGLVYAAELGWGAEGAVIGRLDKILLEAGRVENAISAKQHNRSRLNAVFFATREGMQEELKTLPANELKRTVQSIGRVSGKLSRGTFPRGEALEAAREMKLGLRMAAWAAKRAQWTLEGKSTQPLVRELRELIKAFKLIWRIRARPGGLQEAVVRMRAVEKEL